MASYAENVFICDVIMIGSGSGLSPVRRQAITWTNDELLSVDPQECILIKSYLKSKTFQSYKCIQNAECKVTDFLSRGHWGMLKNARNIVWYVWYVYNIAHYVRQWTPHYDIIKRKHFPC